MCGRYRRRSGKERIAEAFQLDEDLDELDLGAEDDIAPGSIQPVVHIDEDGSRHIEVMRWGFKLPDRLLFVARSEGIDQASFWKEKFNKRRCIVPADSFFEWAQAKSGKKPKYEFSVPAREPFGMAGLWAPWKNPKTGKWEPTFAIITTEANAVMRPIKDRQPTILEPGDYTEYLTASDRPPVHLLRILPDDEMKFRLADQVRVSAQEPTLFDRR